MRRISWEDKVVHTYFYVSGMECISMKQQLEIDNISITNTNGYFSELNVKQ